MHKSIPFYYIVTLWTVAIVSVFLIVKPLLLSLTQQNNTTGLPGLTQSVNEPNEYAVNNAVLKESSQNEIPNKNDDSDLIFYNKTAFIRYFSDKYTAEELAVSYNKAVAEKSADEGKAPIRVIRKSAEENTKNSFSGGFDVRPVPVSNK